MGAKGQLSVLVLGGTTEGRRVLERLSSYRKLKLIYSSLTSHGSLVAQAALEGTKSACELKFIDGALVEACLRRLLSFEQVDFVVDATHPYARSIHKTIFRVCSESDLKLMRFMRELPVIVEDEHCHLCNSMEEALEYLKVHHLGKRIFACTGAHSLEVYCKHLDPSQFFARILPVIRSWEIATHLGIDPARLIFKQGPFSLDENKKDFMSVGAEVLVTKNGGAEAGIAEKLQAARELGMDVLVIRPPLSVLEQLACEEGLTKQEALCAHADWYWEGSNLGAFCKQLEHWYADLICASDKNGVSPEH